MLPRNYITASRLDCCVTTSNEKLKSKSKYHSIGLNILKMRIGMVTNYYGAHYFLHNIHYAVTFVLCFPTKPNIPDSYITKKPFNQVGGDYMFVQNMHQS